MRGARLPAGWTLEAIRNVSGDQEATALDTERSVEWVAGPGCRARIHPEIVLGFRGLCLVKPVNDEVVDGEVACAPQAGAHPAPIGSEVIIANGPRVGHAERGGAADD
ncbi:hypothetical protein [Streptomyces lydicus]|uniref:hypothetical protein n=1 Tax=Streptomyces lydicus TaxID=47763 RepID=UPI0036E73B43